MLAAKKLSKSYGGAAALDALDLEIPAGEVFCLLGPNGAGKTTTLNLFLGFTRPSSGAAYVAGAHVEPDPIGARRKIAYVPEQVRLYPHLTGCENLAYFLGLSGARAPSPAELSRLLVAAGLPEGAAHRPAGGYSKGMRQKVVLALSQARSAGALLLDEPTSGLDPGAVRELCAAIRRESDRGAAVLMVTHDLGAVASIAHRIGIMKAGRLIHVASAAGLSEADVLSLYRRHFEGPERAAPPPPSRRAAPEALS
ncbi:ABC transporter ATP-binding protein [Sorangium cellulosum]|uniref:ABC transporter ATP-binding protein n=1 Tax=Sorangium cellulosum TaxID=56 RepID=A0A4P2QDC6_SORCE|nr:ABC transporter ATP-binding protein [Sorangium cellulosum]AUX27411.1 ABC transporter ATP-binding protein [Sorangium cellulosum]